MLSFDALPDLAVFRNRLGALGRIRQRIRSFAVNALIPALGLDLALNALGRIIHRNGKAALISHFRRAVRTLICTASSFSTDSLPSVTTTVTESLTISVGLRFLTASASLFSVKV